ncbi:hypothetical protein HDU78_011314 [Chytriomyces hyalinus]|nr:hypothetical protein HDU78_011314 [Chytriomyces hyalinus]
MVQSTLLQETVVLAWSTDMNATASRLLAAVSASDAVAATAKLALTPELDAVDVDVANLGNSAVSLVSINGTMAAGLVPTLAVEIVSKLVQSNVRQLVLVAALNVGEKEGRVYSATLNCEHTQVLDTIPLSTSAPLNDSFLGALIPILHLTQSIQTTLLATPAKRERTADTFHLLRGISETQSDAAIPLLGNALSNYLNIQVDSEKARRVILPCVKAAREMEGKVDKKDDLQLMYL